MAPLLVVVWLAAWARAGWRESRSGVAVLPDAVRRETVPLMVVVAVAGWMAVWVKVVGEEARPGPVRADGPWLLTQARRAACAT